MEKIYLCVFMFVKEPTHEISTYLVKAESSQQALSTALAYSESLDFIRQGFYLACQNATQVRSDVAPFNSDKGVFVIEGEAVYLRTDGQISEAFKKDLQQLLSRHCVPEPAVFPEYTDKTT